MLNLEKSVPIKANELQTVSEADKGRFIWGTSSAKNAVGRMLGITPKRFFENGFYSGETFYLYSEVVAVAVQSVIYKQLFITTHTEAVLWIKTSDGVEHQSSETNVLKGQPSIGFSDVENIISRQITGRMGREIDEKGITEWADGCFLTSSGIVQRTSGGEKSISYGDVTSVSLPNVIVAGTLAAGCIIRGNDGTVIKVGTTYNRIPAYCVLAVLCPQLG